MRRLLQAVAAVLCLAVTGCGMGPEHEPVAIDVSIPTGSTTEPALGGPRAVTVYLLRGTHLKGVSLASPDRSIATAVELLSAGPPEHGPGARGDLRTAVPPDSVALVGVDPATATAVVEVTASFVTTSGVNQLLAVAQVVWTVTESPAVRLVRMTRDGNPLDVPTDEGLTSTPVGRADYGTVAPLPARSDDVAPTTHCRVAVPC